MDRSDVNRGAALWVACLLPTSALGGHKLEGRDISRGQSVYAEQCASCHGAELQGQPNWQRQNTDGTLPAPPHDATGHTWHHDNQLLFAYTKRGGQEALAARGVTNFTSAMPAFGDVLSDEEIWDVLAYIRSTWPKRVQDIQAGMNPPHS